MGRRSLNNALPWLAALLLVVTGLPGLAQQPDPAAMPEWYSIAEFQQEVELLKNFVALNLTAEEWQQFAQLWQQFRFASAIQDQAMRTQLNRLRQRLAKADSQEAFDRAAGQLQELKDQLEPTYNQALDATVAAVKKMLGPERCEKLEIKNTLFDWAQGVIDTAQKIRNENPSAWETIREDIIGSLAEHTSAGLEVFPVSEVRFWLNNVSTMSDTLLEQRKWELYRQFAYWLWPQATVDMAISELEKKDHVAEYIKGILTHPMMPYALQAKLAAVGPPSPGTTP